MKIELTYCCGCLNKKLCACLSEKLPYFCKNCLLFSVNEIRKIEKRDCPVGLLCCFKCGRNLEESKFEFKKNSLELKTWCVDCCLAESLRLKEAPRCEKCGGIAPDGRVRCRKCERLNSGE